LREPQAALPDLVPLTGDVPEVTVTCRLASAIGNLDDVADSHVVLTTRGGMGTVVHRDPRAVELLTPVTLSMEALVHPLLTVPLAILARWRGDITLHGGGFVHAGAAWGLVGERTAGKSTMLAVLGDRGVPIVADDLLVIDDGWVRAGPSCVDLRPDVAVHLPSARDLGELGSRPRMRLATPPSPDRAPLRGLFVLEWHDDAEPELVAMTTWERIQLIHRQEAIGLLGAAEPGKVMDLLEVPMWRFRRKRQWGGTPAAVEALLAAAVPHAGV